MVKTLLEDSKLKKICENTIQEINRIISKYELENKNLSLTTLRCVFIDNLKNELRNSLKQESYFLKKLFRTCNLKFFLEQDNIVSIKFNTINIYRDEEEQFIHSLNSTLDLTLKTYKIKLEISKMLNSEEKDKHISIIKSKANVNKGLDVGLRLEMSSISNFKF